MALSLSKYIGYACKLLLCLSMFCFVDEQKHFYRQFISFLPYFSKFCKNFTLRQSRDDTKKARAYQSRKNSVFPGLEARAKARAIIPSRSQKALDRGCSQKALDRGGSQKALDRSFSQKALDRGCSQKALDRGCSQGALAMGCSKTV